MSIDKHTPIPWQLWEGPLYVGGGADLCIGAGEKWLVNMEHRNHRCKEIGDDGHFEESCTICRIDADAITEEQRANAEFIVHCCNSHDMLVKTLNYIAGNDGDHESFVEAAQDALNKLRAQLVTEKLIGDY